ncbi:MAG: peptidylprolyl isomerase [Clostridia bacterium]|nr:peptidylprolyl isomerase [Clostridia bacterium]
MMRKMKYMKSILALILTVAMMLSLSTFLNSCGEGPETENEGSTGGGAVEETETKKKTIYRLSSEKTNYVRIQIKNYGTIVIELYPDIAPETVKFFQELIQTKYYDDSTFHRILKDSVAEGGIPTDQSKTETLPTLADETSSLTLSRGVVSLLREEEKGAKFFVCLGDTPEVEGTYVAFGKVVDGFDTLDHLNEVPNFHGQVLGEKIEMLELRFVYPDLVGGRT